MYVTLGTAPDNAMQSARYGANSSYAELPGYTPAPQHSFDTYQQIDQPGYEVGPVDIYNNDTSSDQYTPAPTQPYTTHNLAW